MTFLSDPIRFVAIDPGWVESGVALFVGGEYSDGIIIRPPDVSVGNRLLYIAVKVRRFCEKSGASFVAVESFAHKAQGSAVQMVAGAGYAVRMGAAQFPTFDVPIATWKATVGKDIASLKTGNSRGYLVAVTELIGKRPLTPNDADAMIMGWCIAKWLGGETRLAGAKKFIEEVSNGRRFDRAQGLGVRSRT